jgi:hypothetical protein
VETSKEKPVTFINNPNILSQLQVSSLAFNETNIKQYFTHRVEHFQAGQISSNFTQWQALTSDSEILSIVKGLKIEFSTRPQQHLPNWPTHFSPEERIIIHAEIIKLLAKGVIQVSTHEQGEYISPIFVSEKKDGSFRMILNLKKLNVHVVYHHFKMESIWTAIRLMTPNCFMASIDLKDAYYSVPIALEDQKYLKFEWDNTLYQFTCFPNGLACCPRKFTKLMKPVFAMLRQMGHQSSPYIDDSFLTGYSYEDCAANVVDTIQLFDKLGFVAHPDKSVFIPTQELVFLGFVLNSVTMQVRLTPDKATKLARACQDLLTKPQPTVRQVARVTGLLVSSFPGVAWGPLYYRMLEADKTAALHYHKGNFDKPMSLSLPAKQELEWWINNIPTAFNPILRDEPKITLKTDASKLGWGGVVQDHSTGGLWSVAEATEHINYLEMLAVFHSLKSFRDLLYGKHVRVMVDNTTAECVIRQMGTSHGCKLNELAKAIWQWCAEQDIWITMSHIPGCENTQADKESRVFNLNTEWCLSKSIFKMGCQKLQFTPNIHLFASRINHQLKPYVSYRPDPEAIAVNAFHISWTHYSLYAFPPFSVIMQVLQKIQEDQATGIVVIPNWPTQVWWTRAMDMLVQQPVLLPRDKHLLFLPSHPEQIHPLHNKLCLLLCHLSGNSSVSRAFRQQLQESSRAHRSPVQGNNTHAILRNGSATVASGVLIPFVQM